MTQDDIPDILRLFADSEFAQLRLAMGSVRVAVNRAPAAVSGADPPAAIADVVAPLLGEFQAGCEPGAPAFVRCGATVAPDTIVGMIRIGRDATAVQSGLRGTVVDVLARDGQFVEFGETLLRVDTRSAAAGSRPDANGDDTR